MLVFSLVILSCSPGIKIAMKVGDGCVGKQRGESEKLRESRFLPAKQDNLKEVFSA